MSRELEMEIGDGGGPSVESDSGADVSVARISKVGSSLCCRVGVSPWDVVHAPNKIPKIIKIKNLRIIFIGTARFRFSNHADLIPELLKYTPNL